MNFNNSDGFDELNPRAAPAPESFSAVPISSAVPEVSLVFSPSSFSKTQSDNKSPLKNLDNAASLFTSRIVTDQQLRDVAFNDIQKGRLGERSGISTMKSISHLPSAKIREGTDYSNGKSIGNRDVNHRKTVPSLHLLDSSAKHGVSYAPDIHEAKSYQLASNYKRQSAVNVPPTFHNSYGYSVDSRAGSLKTSDINVPNDIVCGSQIAAPHEKGMCTSQMFEKPHGCIPNRLSPPAISFEYYSHGKQQCCPNHNKCVLAQDMIINKGSTPTVHGPPMSSKFEHPISHSDPCKYGSCCVYHTSCKEFDNMACHSGRYLNTQMNVTNKCNGNFCDKNEVVHGKRNICTREDIMLLNAKQNKYTTHKFKDDLQTNVNNSKDMFINKESGIYYAGVEDSNVKVQSQDDQCKRNYDSSPKTSTDSVGKQNDRRSSDTSILQEIALMNHKQCSILQGLLQQVVVMQADQMKILSEINEKLRNNGVSEVTVPNKHENNGTSAKIIPKGEDAATQTLRNEMVDFSCQKCDESETTDSLDVRSSSKNGLTNAEVKNIMNHQNHCDQEKEQYKARNLHDRAVSWSAVHGVETVEESFTLHGVCVPTMVEQLPSSIHTMHLHVQDYHSSASFESFKDSRLVNDSCCENGQDTQKGSWTLYDNIVGHVKKFLQAVPCENGGNATQKTSQVEAIRFATIEKIRQLGVSVYENSTEIKEVNAPGKIHFDSNVASQPPYKDSTPVENCSDANMELQALALKYLQDEDLSDLMKWNQSCNTPSILKTGQKSANISLATQHYLEKYQLLPVGTDFKDRGHNNANCGKICAEDNILDITTLKKQPKLL